MRKLFIIIVVFFASMLSACSFDDVTNSVEYVNEVTKHINTLNEFAEEAPKMIQDAATSPELIKELENKLVALKEEIESFNMLDHIPAAAEDIHQELLAQNKIVLDEINRVMENGQLSIEKLETSEIFDTIDQATDLLNEIKDFGQ